MRFSQIPSSELFVDLSEEQEEFVTGGKVSYATENYLVSQTQNPQTTGDPSGSSQPQYSQQGDPNLLTAIMPVLGSFYQSIPQISGLSSNGFNGF